jgi:hypothetical protein
MTKSRVEKTLSFLNFEDILQYVAIPKLNIEESTTLANMKRPRGRAYRNESLGRSDLGYIFDRLREKNVKTVLKVIVDDTVEPAHSDEAIEDALRDMGVEIWDWKKTDLCSEVIYKVSPNLREVHLYWSGNNAILRGWGEPGGLKRLESLKIVHLHVQQGLETQVRTRQNVQAFRERMSKLLPDLKINEEWPRRLRDNTDPSLRLNNDNSEYYQRHEWIDCMRQFKHLLLNAEKYVEEEEGYKIEKRIEEPIVVALIDDGINVNALESTPIGGRSFCTRDENQNLNYPYYVSSGGHGTVMASQIYRVCPRAQLYVLKLEDYATESSTRQISAKSAALVSP